jgi:hypothetical protein
MLRISLSLRFVPSERIVEVQPFLSVNLWREIRTTFRLNVAFQQDQLQTATGGVDVSVPLHRGVALTGRATAGVQQPLVAGVRTGSLQPTYDLGLGITVAGPPEVPGLRIRSEIFLQQQDGVQRAGASGQVRYDFWPRPVWSTQRQWAIHATASRPRTEPKCVCRPD